MSLQQCNKVCVNIEQNFSGAEQTRARANIGMISPVAGQEQWYNGQHTVGSDEANNNVVMVQLPQMPSIIRNATGRTFIAKAMVHITEVKNGDNYKIGGSPAIALELRQSGNRLLGATMCIITDLGERWSPTLATTIQFNISSSDDSTLYLYLYPPLHVNPELHVIPEGTILSIDVQLQYVQSL